CFARAGSGAVGEGAGNFRDYGRGISRAEFTSGRREVRGTVAAAVSATDGNANRFSGAANDWFLRVCQLGADIFVEARLFAGAFAGIHDADCADLAGGADSVRVDGRPAGAKVDDRGAGIAGGGAWAGIWECAHADGSGCFWGAADALQLLVLGGISRVSGGVVSYTNSRDRGGIYV